MRPISTVVLVLILLASRGVWGQTLADVAKAEEARRKSVKQPAKVYTNENLGAPVSSSSSTPATASTTPATSAKDADPSKADAGKPNGDAAKKDDQKADEKKDEKYWRGRLTSAQDALNHDKVLAEALQSRVNALTTDFVNRDDPAQRAVIEDNRKTALAEMDRINKDIEKQTKAIADLQEEARKANVPPGWLR
jgi:hypothetical protein